jgi:hypothetical protein
VANWAWLRRTVVCPLEVMSRLSILGLGFSIQDLRPKTKNEDRTRINRGGTSNRETAVPRTQISLILISGYNPRHVLLSRSRDLGKA